MKQGFKECGKNRILEAMAGEKGRNEEEKKGIGKRKRKPKESSI